MKDTINYVHRNNEKSQKQIHQMMEVLDLVDTYRELHPESKRYSWRDPHKKQARLDYFLTSSDFQAFITGADIDVAYRSDHSPVYIELNFSEDRRRKGTGKFNNSFLYDKEYINIAKECIENVINQYKCDDCENLFQARFNIDDQLLWVTFKLIIRGRTISYSSFKKKERDKRENDLENTLQKLQLGQDNITEVLNRVESELRKLRDSGTAYSGSSFYCSVRSSNTYCQKNPRYFL
jgi:hypothetical protein